MKPAVINSVGILEFTKYPCTLLILQIMSVLFFFV